MYIYLYVVYVSPQSQDASPDREMCFARDGMQCMADKGTLLVADALSLSLSHTHICPRAIRHRPGEGAHSRT